MNTENLKLENVSVHVPFVEIREVLLEVAKCNGVPASSHINNHKYFFWENGMIQGAHNPMGLFQEVGVNEYMQLILDQNKSIGLKLNDKVSVTISNKGRKIVFHYATHNTVVCDKDINDLKWFLQQKDPVKFKSGEYCVFPSSEIRRAFGKEVLHSHIRLADIGCSSGPETVLFYEGSAASIWLKKDEAAYKAYEPNATRISMEEFADRLYPNPKLTLFGHNVTKIGTVVKFGCQGIEAVNLHELFCVIAEQRGEDKAQAL